MRVGALCASLFDLARHRPPYTCLIQWFRAMLQGAQNRPYLMLCGSAEIYVALLPSNSGHRKTCPKKQLNRFFLVQIDIAQVVHSSISVTSALTEWERRAGGHRRRHVRRKKVVPGSPVVHDLCAALRSKSGAKTSFFAAARPQIVRVRCASGGRVDELSDVLTLCSWARPLLTAVMYMQLGTPCPTSRTISEWEQATK